MEGDKARPPRSQSSGVRVVAKFMKRSHVAKGHSSSDGDHLSVSFSDEGHALVSISPGAKGTRSTQKSVYQLDYCYEEEKGAEEIYAVEVKPLVQKLFDGTNCRFISYGAHHRWPVQLFEGSGENPSLVEMAMSDILHGNAGDIEISEYEVFQDQIYDLLEPKEKGVKLKSLSKVKVNTLDEFKSSYCQSNRCLRAHRGHRGLIIYTGHTSKLNFLDLGGYGGTTENKSLHAIMKIVYALNSKNPISYRDSRLTYQLHDLISWESPSVVIACLDRSDDQRNMRTLRLASYSSHVANQIQYNTVRRPTEQYATPIHGRYSMAVIKSKPVYGKVNRCYSIRPTTKKLGSVKDKNLNNDKEVKKLIPEEVMQGELADSQANLSTMPSVQLEIIPEVKPEVNDISDSMKVDHEESAESGILSDISDSKKVDHEESAESGNTSALMPATQQEDISDASEGEERPMLMETVLDYTASDSIVEEGRTPAPVRELSVSERLMEISNSLKFIPDSGKPIHIGTPKRVSFSSCAFEPETPNDSTSLGVMDSGFHCSDMPQERLKARTTGMKKSLQKECLTFINSANKEDLKRLKGIGEVRANRILQLRDINPEPFKNVEDLKNIGITQRQFNKMAIKFMEDC
ncbi:Kinesin-like protein KIF22 [Rhynchospora pubera]|uniref:Kinesin-like protein KIF22 n=1 Tax=Rhynchospora pubera TaxID=906938 RepID=A0AAV8F4V8_9POAL|nr:Kinesin-like protein KIF22 [Rhynchospora pubera]